MIEDEIIKHIPEAVGVAKVAAASIPFTAIVKRMLGPAADEIAQMWADKVKMWRFERQASCVKKAEEMLESAGITPHTVSPKILFPLLEGASLEENDDLHTMWAALLANAASPEGAEKVSPGFIATLKQMAPDEAALLNWMFLERIDEESFQSVVIRRLAARVPSAPEQEMLFDDPFEHSEVVEAYCSLGFGEGEMRVNGLQFETCLYNLEADRLVRIVPHEDAYLLVSLTFRGGALIEACRPPQPKS